MRSPFKNSVLLTWNVLISRLNLKYLGWPYREYIKTGKNGDFGEELLRKNNFEAVLAISVVLIMV